MTVKNPLAMLQAAMTNGGGGTAMGPATTPTLPVGAGNPPPPVNPMAGAVARRMAKKGKK